MIIKEIHFRPGGNPDGTYEDKWKEYIPYGMILQEYIDPSN